MLDSEFFFFFSPKKKILILVSFGFINCLLVSFNFEYVKDSIIQLTFYLVDLLTYSGC